MEVTHQWACHINRCRPFTCIYFDLTKAFDRVDHTRLLAKIDALCVDWLTIEWIRSYSLVARSVFASVILSVPSIRAPQVYLKDRPSAPDLFSIYMLDLPHFLPLEVSYKLYADDLKVYSSSEYTDEALIQAAVVSVSAWCRANNMTISTKNCPVMSTLRPCPLFVMDGSNVPAVGSFRDLGVTFSPGLDLSTHIAEVALAASRVSNLMLRCFIITSPDFYIRLYKAVVIPRILYCSVVWRPYLRKHILALEKIQSKFTRRVALPCNIPSSDIVLEPIVSLFDRADLAMLDRLRLLSCFHCMFDESVNTLRGGRLPRPKQCAKTGRINSMFAWRVSRLARV